MTCEEVEAGSREGGGARQGLERRLSGHTLKVQAGEKGRGVLNRGLVFQSRS